MELLIQDSMQVSSNVYFSYNRIIDKSDPLADPLMGQDRITLNKITNSVV